MKPDRWLATVLFTDIVGSTEKAAELGDQRWRELLKAHHALARRELQRFGGRELNTTGDGFLATFEVPERAVRCACAIRDAVRRLGLEIRAGLHTGEVEVIERTVGGLAVHIGARVAAEAAPGEVLVSGTVRDMVAGSGFGFEERGARALKGVPGEWRLYAVVSAPVRLPVASFWSRAREARLPRVLLGYLAACAVVLWLTAFLRDEFQLPPWVLAFAVVLLLVGLVVLSATAWVQSQPFTAARAEREEVPGSWEIDLRDATRSVARGRLPHLTWGRAILGGVFAFSLLFGLAGLYVVVQDRGRSFTPKEALAGPGPALAVLPFRIVGSDLELWREGMVDLLSTNLDGAAGIRTVAPRTLLSRWGARIAKGREPSDEQALQVAREVGAKYALLGSMVVLGGEVRLSAQVYDLRSGQLAGETQVRGAPDSVPALVDRLSLEVLREALVKEGDALPHLDLRRLTTASLPALKAYLEGEQAFRRSQWEEAIASLTRAVEADSTFALALHRLSLAHGWIVGFSPQSVEYSRRAVQLIDRLPEREALLLQGDAQLNEGRAAAIETLEKLTTRYPDDAEGWYSLGDAYFHVGRQALHPLDKFSQALRRALELDPSFGPAYIHLVGDAFVRADSAEARELVRRYREIDPTSVEAQGFDLAYRLAWGDAGVRDRARRELATADIEVLRVMVSYMAWANDFPDAALAASRVLLDERHPSTARESGRWALIRTYVGRGRVREAREALAEAGPTLGVVLLGPGTPRERLLVMLSMTGYDVGSDARRAAEVLARDPAPQDRFLLGALAAREGRWQEVQRETQALESAASVGGQPGEAYNQFDGPALAQALRGYAAGQRGDSATAVRELQAALPKITGSCPGAGCIFHSVLRYELGRLLLETGRARDALPYLESVEFYPTLLTTAELHLGRAYEELGDLTEARLHYERFVRWWEDCDPELRPLWEEGRQALARLTGVRRL